MIEILIVALLCSWVGKTAKKKGRRSGPYIGITLGLWFGLEILGVIIGLSLFDDFLPAYGLALGGAALGGIIAAVIVSGAQPVSGYMAPGQMPYYPPQQGQAPNYPTGQQPYASAPEPLTAPVGTPGSIVCPGCATPSRADAAFCHQCGTALK